VRFEELRRLLQRYGWELGSLLWKSLRIPSWLEKIVIPFRRPHVLASYVRIVLSLTGDEDDDG
jgi:hypothetical protein